ncbi:MAG: acyloxyacyl hydrolase [Alphaproteobacteria bacterium]|nr:acyloxyacyl hydrolase [Alphaproteobacteria bacterium]MDX5369767.1 acyloxyacyl hydrolase [Alphaproteobacteria bacterium]MDX5464391.1 acyloxyacyl hydrolase [Alphaproteobacteria bacterium]
MAFLTRAAASAAIAAVFMFPGAVHAQDALLDIEIGAFDPVERDDEAVSFRLAWLSGKPLLWKIAPMAGAMATTDGAVYGYGGLYADLFLTDNLFLMPSVAAGLYADGDGKDLGHAVQFRSGAMVGWRFDGGMRVGVSYHHLSNGGLGDRNPGVEILGFSLMLPLQ